ncbi:hypothetical protein ACVXZ4_08340 [Lacisediminihabitans sp. FW035]
MTATTITNKKNPVSALTAHVRSSAIWKLGSTTITAVLFIGIGTSSLATDLIGLAGFATLLVAAAAIAPRVAK